MLEHGVPHVRYGTGCGANGGMISIEYFVCPPRPTADVRETALGRHEPNSRQIQPFGEAPFSWHFISWHFITRRATTRLHDHTALQSRRKTHEHGTPRRPQAGRGGEPGPTLQWCLGRTVKGVPHKSISNQGAAATLHPFPASSYPSDPQKRCASTLTNAARTRARALSPAGWVCSPLSLRLSLRLDLSASLCAEMWSWSW